MIRVYTYLCVWGPIVYLIEGRSPSRHTEVLNIAVALIEHYYQWG